MKPTQREGTKDTPIQGAQPHTTPPATAQDANPQWKFREEVPTLTERNYIKWKSALANILIEHDFQPIAKPGFILPTHETGTFYGKACASCNRMIAASIENDITDLLPDDNYTHPPSTVIETLDAILINESETVHAILEKETHAIKLTTDTTIRDYIRSHSIQRARMITAKYPHISNERTTVKFMVEGLREHHQFKDIIRALKILGIPNTIEDLYERLLDIEEENAKADPAQTYPQGESSGERHLPPHQLEHYTRRAPYNPEERLCCGRGRGRWGQTRNFNTKQIAQIAQVMAALNNVRGERGGERCAWRRGTGTRRDTQRASQAHNTENSPQVTDNDELEDANINAITERLRYISEVAHDSDCKYILD